MINSFQAAVLGFIQGLTELFPISSLGHSVILPRLLGWNLDQNAPSFLTFLIATHLATAIVLFVFFVRDWVGIFKGLGRCIRDRTVDPADTYARLGLLLIVGTVPVGILGLIFEKPIRALFATPLVAAGFLIINGVLLFAAERLRRRHKRLAQMTSNSALTPETATGEAARVRKTVAAPVQEPVVSDVAIAALSWKQALGVGATQAAALIPGISRSGSSMIGGLLAGLNNENAARFSFLLATPVIGAAALLKLPELFSPHLAGDRGAFLIGAVCSGLAAWLSTKFLLRFFQTRTLIPFGIYCIVGGALYFTALLIIG